MSKGHMQDLQGFRTISSPSASPVDAYGGGVNAPKVSAADQLASAFGTVSKYGQKAAAQAAAEEAQLNKDLASAAYQRALTEKDGEVVTAVQMGELHPQFSQTIIAPIIEKGARNQLYNQYLAEFSELDDDLIYDDVKLKAHFQLEQEKLVKRMGDAPFASAGALRGFNEAKSEVMRGILNKQAAHTRKLSTQVITDTTKITLNKYNLDTDEGFNSAVDSIALDLASEIETSPNSKSVTNQNYVDAIIKYATENPLSGASKILKDKRLSYLNTKETKAKLIDLAGVLPGLAHKALQNKAAIKKAADDRLITQGTAKLQELALNGDRDGILKAMGMANNSKSKNPEVAVALFEAGEKFLSSTYVLEGPSKRAAQALDSDLVAMAIKGELDRESANMMIDGAEMRESERDALRGNLDRILSGNDLIAASKHNTQYNQRVGNLASALDDTLLASIEGQFTGQLLEPQVRDIWDDTVFDLIQNYAIENDKAPEGTALRVLYDQAEDIAKTKMDEIRGLSPPPPPPKEEPQPQPVAPNTPQVGEVRTAADGTKATFLGGDPEDDNNYEIITGEPKPQEETSGAGLEEVIEQVMSTLTD